MACGLAALGLAALALGCRGAPTQFTWARTPASGATSTCPEGVVDLHGDGTPTSDQVRCSYADAAAGQARVTGKVLEDVPGGLGNAIEGTEVALVRVDAHGRAGAAVATARTDPQGGFTLRARVGAGSYAVASGGALSSPWTWEGRGPWTLGDVRVRVPVPASAP